MRLGFALALSAVLAAGLFWHAQSVSADGVELVSKERLDLMRSVHFGGVSGYERVGTRQVFLTDRGTVFIRDDAGLRGLRLLGEDGLVLARGMRDSEGLALSVQGFAISFEGRHRVALYDADGRLQRILPVPEAFGRLGGNAGLEALAVDGAGRLVAIPEQSGATNTPYPVFVFELGAWRQAALPRRGAFLPVGADFGPKGRLYLLERDFLSFGFRTRIRRFDWDGAGFSNEETLLQTGFGTHGNMEGIAVFEEGSDTFIELVSDNNFLPVMRGELVRYRVLAP